MHPISILFLGLAMSTDAFAAAVGKGATMSQPRWADALRTGLVFGVIEATTPVIGWLLGSAASDVIQDWDHWIAFTLLTLLGLHVIHKAVRGGTEEQSTRSAATSGMGKVLLAALATSIDALAVGIGLAFVEVNILAVAAVIGLCTFAMVTIGVMAGRAMGTLFGRRAEIAGGVILILVGATIVYEHVFAV